MSVRTGWRLRLLALRVMLGAFGLHRAASVKAVHLVELRTALNQAYQTAGRVIPTYTGPALGSLITTIGAVHVNESRVAVHTL